jgi:hypothetical protein
MAVAMLLLLVAAPGLVLAQGRLIFTDETGNLNRNQVAQAAQPLLNRGLTVAVYAVNQGGEADMLSRLRDAGQLSGDGRARTNLLVIYVSQNPRYSAIRYGDSLNAALDVNNNAEAIRVGTLNAGLSAGDFTTGFSNTLRAVENAIANPPVPGGGSVTNIDPTPLVIGGAGVLGVGATAYAVSRRRKAARLLGAARTKAEEARRGAGGAIAQFGQRLKNTEEKAQFDKVSYAQADVQWLASQQRQIEQQFAQVQTRFDDVGEKLNQRAKPEIPHYEEAAQGFSQVQGQMATLSEQLDAVDARRAELDKLARQAPEEVDRAKKS